MGILLTPSVETDDEKEKGWEYYLLNGYSTGVEFTYKEKDINGVISILGTIYEYNIENKKIYRYISNEKNVENYPMYDSFYEEYIDGTELDQDNIPIKILVKHLASKQNIFK